MRRAPHLFTFGAALLLLWAPAAMAMSFGRTVAATTLGQPLNFIAYLAIDDTETLARECVGAEVLIGDNRVAAENVRVTLEPARAAGERRIRVTTRTIVDEPIVTVDVSAGCRSQMSRRFVAFVDPPALRLASAEADESFAPQRVDSQVAPLLDIVRGADRGRDRVEATERRVDRDGAPERRRGARRVAPGSRLAAAPAARDGAPRPAAAASTRKSARPDLSGAHETRVARATPRLRLEAASALAAPPARAAASAPTLLAAVTAPVTAELAAQSALASATAGDAPSTALASERARILELEAGMARLQSDSQAQRTTLGALQARLRQAEGDRYANGLVYTLAAAMLFFALLAAAFWALRPRQRRRARWFDAQANQQRRAAAAGATATPPQSAAPAQAPAVSQHPSQWRDSAHAILPVTTPATIGGLEVTTVLAPQSHYARMAEAGASANAAAASVTRSASPSMEELIDLEQQAEFYVVLGQDEAAIALLNANLGEAGAASPLPYLQLLEIHQRRGDRASYEELRRDYQKRFDAFAPEWSSDLHFGRSLEEYPQAIARLQALWPTPLHAMRTLDGLLFRRSEADEAFDFPAYRELLFLYSIARELAGQVETDFGTIDLFLPLEDAAAEPSRRDDGKAAVDLDVSGWPDDTQPEGLVLRRSAGRRSAA